MSSAAKVLAVALGEVGYLEKDSNSQLDSKTANAGYNNYTKYARDLDAIPHFYNGKKQGYAWCDVFVDWCFVQAFGVDEAKKLLGQPDDSLGAGCAYSKEYYNKMGQLGTTPKVGAQVFFGTQHTGLVTKVDGNKFYTVEGNTSSDAGVVANGGAVCEKSYTVKSGYTFGYPAYTEGDTVVTPSKPKVYLSPAMHRANPCCYKREDGQQCYEALENNEYVDILEPILNRCGIDTMRGYRRTPMNDDDGEQIMYQNIRESNAWGADVHYVSHTNAVGNALTQTTTKGYRPIYYKGSANGKKLAELMVKYRSEIYPYDVKVSARTDLHELADTNAVCIYQEHVFHDNVEDATWFHTHMKEAAIGDAKALCEYFGISYVDEPVTPEPEPAEDVLYRVQAGAFRVRENAEAYLRSLKEAGFDGFIIEVKQ